MSRIGRKPVPILAGVSVSVDGRKVTVEGSGKKLEFVCRKEVAVTVNDADKQVEVTRHKDDRSSRALHGLTRSLINNMIIGVKDGYEKRLELHGVGYVANLEGNLLKLRVGFHNEIHKTVPGGLDVTVPTQTSIIVKGPDKQMVGQFAAEVRAVRKPEPYKGKGIRYVGEYVKIKPGKQAGA